MPDGLAQRHRTDPCATGRAHLDVEAVLGSVPDLHLVLGEVRDAVAAHDPPQLLAEVGGGEDATGMDPPEEQAAWGVGVGRNLAGVARRDAHATAAGRKGVVDPSGHGARGVVGVAIGAEADVDGQGERLLAPARRPAWRPGEAGTRWRRRSWSSRRSSTRPRRRRSAGSPARRRGAPSARPRCCPRRWTPRGCRAIAGPSSTAAPAPSRPSCDGEQRRSRHPCACVGSRCRRRGPTWIRQGRAMVAWSHPGPRSPPSACPPSRGSRDGRSRILRRR